MKKVFAAALVLLSVGTSPAIAEGPRATAGLMLGATWPFGDFGDTNDLGVSLAGYLTGDMTYRSSWRLEIGYDRAGASDASEDTCGQLGLVCGADAIKRFNAGVQWTFRDLWPSATPYVFGTVGVYNQEFSQNVVGIDFSQSSTDVGISFGGGFVWMYTSLVGFGADLHFHGVFRDQDLPNAWYLAPSAFMHFRF